MKIAALTTAFAERRFIAACIEQLEGFVDKHLVLVSRKPWQGEEASDETALIASARGASVRIASWESQAEQLNEGIAELRGFDWILIVDADEFYTGSSLSLLRSTLELTSADAVVASDMYVYWKTSQWRLLPAQNDNPTVAVRPSVRFHDMRQCRGEKTATTARLHHFSYVRSDKEMLSKIRSFEHAGDFDTQRWYEDVWKPWKPESRDLHPVYPAKFAQAIFDPAPAEITGRLG